MKLCCGNCVYTTRDIIEQWPNEPREIITCIHPRSICFDEMVERSNNCKYFMSNEKVKGKTE